MIVDVISIALCLAFGITYLVLLVHVFLIWRKTKIHKALHNSNEVTLKGNFDILKDELILMIFCGVVVIISSVGMIIATSNLISSLI